jgi:hypothetical protein
LRWPQFYRILYAGMKLKIKQTMLVFMTIVGIGSLMVAPVVGAAAKNKCGETETSIINCPSGENDNGLWGLLILAINILSTGVGVAAIGGIIWGGFMYLTASDSAEQLRKAKMILWNTTIGLIVYAAMYSLLNFLIPGGLFS